MTPIRQALLALLTAVLLASPVLAQVDTGAIQGTVRDATGGVVPGATVTLINVDMGVSFQTKTNDVGGYQFPLVPPTTSGRFSLR